MSFRYILYRSSLLYFAVITFFFLVITLDHLLIAAEMRSIASVSSYISNSFMMLLEPFLTTFIFAFPIALISLMVGAGRPSVVISNISRAHFVWRVATCISGFALTIPILIAFAICPNDECGMAAGYFVLPAYAILAPIFIVCVVGLLIAEFRKLPRS